MLSEIENVSIYPVNPSPDVAPPYIVYTRTGGEVDYHCGGPSGLVRHEFTFDYWAKNLSECISVGIEIETLFSGIRNDNIKGSFLLSKSHQEEELINGSIFHGIQTYSIWQ